MLVSRFRDDGIGITVAELARALRERGHQLTIGAFRFERDPPPGIHAITLVGSGLEQWNLRTIFNQFDLLHLHQSGPISLSSYWCAKPFVYSFHGIPSFRYSRRAKAILERLVLFAVARNFARIIAPQNCVRTHLEHAYLLPSKKIEVINPGVDLDVFKPDGDGGAESYPRFIFVGDLSRHKRVHLLLLAFAECRKITRCSLQIVGDGAERSSLEDLATKLGIREDVAFHGRIRNDSLPPRYRSSDVYTTASASEAFPLPILEAMASGLPVVASPCPAHAEIIEASGCGRIANPEFAGEFSARMLEVYHERTRYRAHSLSSALKYSWDRTALMTERLYDAVLR